MAARPADHEERMDRARLSLTGLSIGDAFGERFFGPYELVRSLIQSRAFPQPPWPYTDDTQMAVSMVEILGRFGRIDPDALAQAFARRYEPSRGYGMLAHEILQAIRAGASWKDVSRAAFGGQGSMGNGAAMRVAPVGAYFADDLDRATAEARASAEVTHAHEEGKAGAMAVAAAAALAWQDRERTNLDGEGFLRKVAEATPKGSVREGIEVAATLRPEAPVLVAAGTLGNGGRVTAPDTVPYTIWCVSRFRASLVDALWNTVSGMGDRDTTCAIVGGVVAAGVGPEGIPGEWIAAREPLPAI